VLRDACLDDQVKMIGLHRMVHDRRVPRSAMRATRPDQRQFLGRLRLPSPLHRRVVICTGTLARVWAERVQSRLARPSASARRRGARLPSSDSKVRCIRVRALRVGSLDGFFVARQVYFVFGGTLAIPPL